MKLRNGMRPINQHPDLAKEIVTAPARNAFGPDDGGISQEDRKRKVL